MIYIKPNLYLSVEEKELLRLTNPDSIRVEPTYQGPRNYSHFMFNFDIKQLLFCFRHRRANYKKNIC